MDNRILITGGTGFIGQSLCQQLISKGYAPTVFSRQSTANVQALCGRVEALGDLELLRGHPGFGAVINLAGGGIADKRWSDRRQQELRDSCIGLTRLLAHVIRSRESLPRVRVSGFSVGFSRHQTR